MRLTLDWTAYLRPALAGGFLLACLILSVLFGPQVPLQGALWLAVVAGAYMAMNVGANDAANNIGPVVGCQAIGLPGALLLAALFEIAGAMIAGSDVVNTIKEGIIDPALLGEQREFILLMLAALLAGAVWLQLATTLGLPVSTTHAIIGGLLGAGITAGGLQIANWPRVAVIASSWVIAPLLAGLIAAALLYLIKRSINYQTDRVAAAQRVLPLLIAAMGWAFSVYIIHKGLGRAWRTDASESLFAGLVIGLGIYLIVQPVIVSAAERLPNEKSAINQLFRPPLLFAAALLSFAHGANDLANTIGPLAAISASLRGLAIAHEAAIPVWELALGAAGLALGLLLYGARVIRTMGTEITDIDPTRAFCIVMAIAITVTLASQLGLPVSTTHTAVGAVFGVGFLREYLKTHYQKKLARIRHHHAGQDQASIQSLLDRFDKASVAEKGQILKALRADPGVARLPKKEAKALAKLHRQELVKRSLMLKIVSAWLLTLPAAGLLASLIYLLLNIST